MENSGYPKNIKMWDMVGILVIWQHYPKSISYWYIITSTLWWQCAATTSQTTSLELPLCCPLWKAVLQDPGQHMWSRPLLMCSCAHVGTIRLGPSGCVWWSEPWSSCQSQLKALWMGTSTADEFIQQFEALADESELDEVMLTHLFECGLHCSVTKKIYGVELMPKTLKGWKEYTSHFDNQYHRFQALTKDTPSSRYPMWLQQPWQPSNASPSHIRPRTHGYWSSPCVPPQRIYEEGTLLPMRTEWTHGKRLPSCQTCNQGSGHGNRWEWCNTFT